MKQQLSAPPHGAQASSLYPFPGNPWLASAWIHAFRAGQAQALLGPSGFASQVPKARSGRTPDRNSCLIANVPCLSELGDRMLPNRGVALHGRRSRARQNCATMSEGQPCPSSQDAKDILACVASNQSSRVPTPMPGAETLNHRGLGHTHRILHNRGSLRNVFVSDMFNLNTCSIYNLKHRFSWIPAGLWMAPGARDRGRCRFPGRPPGHQERSSRHPGTVFIRSQVMVGARSHPGWQARLPIRSPYLSSPHPQETSDGVQGSRQPGGFTWLVGPLVGRYPDPEARGPYILSAICDCPGERRSGGGGGRRPGAPGKQRCQRCRRPRGVVRTLPRPPAPLPGGARPPPPQR